MERHIDTQLRQLTTALEQMWNLVGKQIAKSHRALKTCDKALAREVIAREKMCNAYELQIDSLCENFIALNNPVAIDLRLALAVLKINNNLERIGDFAESIASFVLKDMSGELEEGFAAKLKVFDMFEKVEQMFALSWQAFQEESTTKAEQIFGLDNYVDEINRDSLDVLALQIQSQPQNTKELLGLHHVVRRIERIGDRCDNIAEEIVFYLDAKVLKHSKADNPN